MSREINAFVLSVICLLAFVSLVRGGQQGWVALTVAAGSVCLLAAGFLCLLWSGFSPYKFRSPLGEGFLLVWAREDLALLLGLSWAWVGLSLPSASPEALGTFLILLGCVGTFLIARSLAFAGAALRLASSLCAMGGLIALIGLLQLFGVLGHGWWNPPQFVAATFVNHNYFAAYLELLLPLSVALWLAAPLHPARRFVVAVSCAVMAIAFIFSCSRGAWLSLTIAASVGLGWLGVGRQSLTWRWTSLLVAVIVAAAIGFLVTHPLILARGMSLLNAPSDPSFQMRQAVWQGSWDLAAERPWLGHGLGSFALTFPRHRPPGLYRLITHAYNEYVQVVTELGLVGLAIGLLLALLLIRRIVRLVCFSQTPWKPAVGLGGFIGLGSVALHSLVDFPWHIPAVAFMFACVAGLLTGIDYHADPLPLQRLGLSGTTLDNPRTTSRWGKRLVRWVLVPVALAGLVAAFRPLGHLIIADAWAHQGRLKREAGKFEEAIASYQRAVRAAPFYSEHHRQVGESLTELAWRRPSDERRSLFKDAATAYRKALELVPHDARSADAFGEVLKALGEVDEADRWLARAIRLDPNNPLYWKRWAELKLMRGEGPEAAEAFRRATRLALPFHFFPSAFEPLDDPNHFIQVGESALLLGRLGMAQAAFTVAAAFDPTHPRAQVGLALCALSQGDAEKAQQLMGSIHDPIFRAKWFAGMADYYFKQGYAQEARAALETSLSLDPTNVLARHLMLVLTRGDQDAGRYAEALDQLLSLNRPPVFVRSAKAQGGQVVWEPEMGLYREGYKTGGGWVLATNGAIHQLLIVPPGKVRMTVTARGTQAKGVWPTMAVYWNGRLIQLTEVASETWTAYEAEAEVKLGESLLKVEFINDLNDLVTLEDRNLRLDKVIAQWGRL